MTPEEFKQAQIELGRRQGKRLSNPAMARLLGVSQRTVDYYRAGAEIPESKVKLLRLMLDTIAGGKK